MQFRHTNEDDSIFNDLGLLDGDQDGPGSLAYEMGIQDRNDYAIMRALMAASTLGCRATKNRLIASP